MDKLRIQTLELLKRALNGALNLEEAGEFLSNLERNTDPIISEAAHAVAHFVTDLDLRERDKAYDAILRAELEQYAVKLKGT